MPHFLSTIEVDVHENRDLIIAHAQICRMDPSTIATMHAAVELHQDRTPIFRVHDFGVDGSILEADSLQDLFRVLHNFFELRLISRYHELLAETNKTSTVVGSLVIFEHSCGLDLAVEDDRVDNVFRPLEVLLHQDTGVRVVLVLASAVSLVFACQNLVVGSPGSLLRVAKGHTDRPSSSLGLDDKRLGSSTDVFKELANIVFGPSKGLADRGKASRSDGIGLSVLVHLGLAAVHSAGTNVGRIERLAQTFCEGIFEKDSVFRAAHDGLDIGCDSEDASQRFVEAIIAFVHDNSSEVFSGMTGPFEVLVAGCLLRSVAPHNDDAVSQIKDTLLDEHSSRERVDEYNGRCMIPGGHEHRLGRCGKHRRHIEESSISLLLAERSWAMGTRDHCCETSDTLTALLFLLELGERCRRSETIKNK
mmetsp:Transcript_93120/g.258857  ORF Transcript_93120/g.258857 Transcript_93120/m.258857 type:complete len:420 (-) Transcript_93120:60-1319(-)